MQFGDDKECAKIIIMGSGQIFVLAARMRVLTPTNVATPMQSLLEDYGVDVGRSDAVMWLQIRDNLHTPIARWRDHVVDCRV